MKIKIDNEICSGCGICELVCSFHHKGVFSPELSSIRVLRDHNTGNISCSVNTTCDHCTGEAQPLCVKYCVYGAFEGVN